MLQKQEEKTADSLILNQSTNLRFNVIHIVCHSERVSKSQSRNLKDAFSMTRLCLSLHYKVYNSSWYNNYFFWRSTL